jgi:hypothetical protein
MSTPGRCVISLGAVLIEQVDDAAADLRLSRAEWVRRACTAQLGVDITRVTPDPDIASAVLLHAESMGITATDLISRIVRSFVITGLLDTDPAPDGA